MPTLNYAPSQKPQLSAVARAGVFALAATSIGCLLIDFYRPGWMQPTVLYVFLPACLVLIAWAIVDHGVRRVILIGAIAGFIAAIAYDVFRLPFVLTHFLPLFKVFPEFGKMILGNDGIRAVAGDNSTAVSFPYYPSEHVAGWAYHFSNGMAFGIMYLAMIGDASRRHWVWGVVMAVGIEIVMLLTPYTNVFGINMTGKFIIVTLLAHVVFGTVMGLIVARATRP